MEKNDGTLMRHSDSDSEFEYSSRTIKSAVVAFCALAFVVLAPSSFASQGGRHFPQEVVYDFGTITHHAYVGKKALFATTL